MTWKSIVEVVSCDWTNRQIFLINVMETSQDRGSACLQATIKSNSLSLLATDKDLTSAA